MRPSYPPTTKPATPSRQVDDALVDVFAATIPTLDTGGEFISRRIDEPIRRMIGGIQDPSCCL
jgi:hypothetical protein